MFPLSSLRARQVYRIESLLSGGTFCGSLDALDSDKRYALYKPAFAPCHHNEEKNRAGVINLEKFTYVETTGTNEYYVYTNVTGD
jgi:hypothetical protein